MILTNERKRKFMGEPLRWDDPAFTITIDPGRRYVELRLVGLWDDAAAARFERQLRAVLAPALNRGGCAIGEQVTLFDNTDFAVQPQDVTQRLGQMALDASIGSRRIAIQLNSALSRVQARRVAPDYALFSDRDEALAWLFEPVGVDVLVRPTDA